VEYEVRELPLPKCILPFVLITLMGCQGRRGVVDSAFQSHLEKFKVEAAQSGVSLNITDLNIIFVDQISEGSSGVVSGKCLDGTIEIVRDYWNAASESRREALLYHELGHCVLGRSHTGGWSDEIDGPKSVMVPDADLISFYWPAHRAYYIREPFQK
jgi:hypothetical protein